MSQLQPVTQSAATSSKLDPITFEVLKNSFTCIVDQMAEQIVRTCHSFPFYNRDVACALADRTGDIVAQGSFDPAAQLGTLHFTTKAVIDSFGSDIAPGDVFVTNDPYRGGTHFSDIRVIRPVFGARERVICFIQSSGHWSDVGGKVPGSFDCQAKEHFGEGLRITPIRLWRRGEYLADVGEMLLSNMRAPDDGEGDLFAQYEGAEVAEQELRRLIARYGEETVLVGFGEVQDYVERLTRARLAELPDGIWESVDYVDRDPSGAEDGLIPIRVKMTIRGDSVHYDFTGSHAVIGSITNAAFGGSFCAVVSGTKMFVNPDAPFNSGFFRAITVELPPNTIVNALWPTAVTGFIMVYEKEINAIVEMWSHVIPERAMAASFNLEYLQIGGEDARPEMQGRAGERRPYFMWYDWMEGGWGGRDGKDGGNGLSPIFGVGLQAQSVEGQERLCPVVTSHREFVCDSGGPGEFRGGLGITKGGRLKEAGRTVVSYVSDRERSVTWGIKGGLPANPAGLWLERDGERRYLGVAFSDFAAQDGDFFWRPSSGGGGHGDPLKRDADLVKDDVADGYVSKGRALKDYGVVITEIDSDTCAYVVDRDATELARQRIRSERRGALDEDPEGVAERYRTGELDSLDLVRQYGVILEWAEGRLLPDTTATFRQMLQRRAAAYWVDE